MKFGHLFQEPNFVSVAVCIDEEFNDEISRLFLVPIPVTIHHENFMNSP